MNYRVLIKSIVALMFVASVFVMISGAQEETARGQRSVWDGIYTEEQAKRGKELFGGECARCHAEDLSGVDEAPALSGGAFLSNWDGLTVGDLSERIRITMPPNQQGRLSRKQIIEILSFMLTANGFPAGKEELDQRTEVLKQIRIEATKPKTR